MTSHHYLTLGEKITLINDYTDGGGLSQHKLCEKYKLSKGAVYNILRRKGEYKSDFQTNTNKGVNANCKTSRVKRSMKQSFRGLWRRGQKTFHSQGP